MEDDASTITANTDRGVKTEEGAEDTKMADAKATYKSWKKKYCKMRIVFEQKREELGKLHAQEAKARATVKRIAIQNDQILDILLDINNCQQIPPNKRMDVSLDPPSDPEAPSLDIDHEGYPPGPKPGKSLKDLLRSVPHMAYKQCKEKRPELVNYLEPFEGEAYPPSFLSPDDVDNYLYELDRDLGVDILPTMAPKSRETNGPPTWDQNLKNLTGGYNWLRKYAPKTFLQDGEADAGDGDHDGGHHSARKSRGGRGERGGRASTRGKRGSAAHRGSDRGDWDASMDDDPDFGSAPSTSRGKRKRDDDGGYRPKGGSSGRPAKKKRKSEGDLGTPTVKKTKKERDAPVERASNKED